MLINNTKIVYNITEIVTFLLQMLEISDDSTSIKDFICFRNKITNSIRKEKKKIPQSHVWKEYLKITERAGTDAWGAHMTLRKVHPGFVVGQLSCWIIKDNLRSIWVQPQNMNESVGNYENCEKKKVTMLESMNLENLG